MRPAGYAIMSLTRERCEACCFAADDGFHTGCLGEHTFVDEIPDGLGV